MTAFEATAAVALLYAAVAHPEFMMCEFFWNSALNY